MSDIHLQQIRSHLQTTFAGKIDMSDYDEQPAEKREGAFLSRAVAALCIMAETDVTPEIAGASITDCGQDKGIDAIHFHPADRILYIVQSKWHHNGHGSIERGDLLKFLHGFRDLINAREERFNKKIKAKWSTIYTAITDTDTRFMLLLGWSGQENIADEQAQDIQDLLAEMNNPTETVSAKILRQAQLHQVVSRGVRGAPINIEVALREWGQTREPYSSYYGQVAATDVAMWQSLHPRLFSSNIRMYLGRTEANAHMLNTLRTDPQNFWFFNNGITVLCGSVRKKPIGGNQREMGAFECKDISIVNGAQTVGAISFTNSQSPESVAKASVFVRFIDLENCPEDFGLAVTKATNTQNNIQARDFVVFDPEQGRLKTELEVDRIQYAVKSGEAIIDREKGFDVEEAAIAMACARGDTALAVLAKREAGALLADITKTPYKLLFNGSVTGTLLWYRVRIMRTIDLSTVAAGRQLTGRNRLATVHGNRLIAHLVFLQLAKENVDIPNGHHVLDVAARIEEVAPAIVDGLCRVINRDHPESYLAVLFKNADKCKTIVRNVIDERTPEGLLF